MTCSVGVAIFYPTTQQNLLFNFIRRTLNIVIRKLKVFPGGNLNISDKEF
jgi:hypothetical protein